MKLRVSEKWSCGSNSHCKNLQKVPIQNKTKPVKAYGKAKCSHNSGSLKCNLLMLSVWQIFLSYFKPLKNAATGHCKCLLLRFKAIHLIKYKYFLIQDSLLLLNLWDKPVCLGEGRKKLCPKCFRTCIQNSELAIQNKISIVLLTSSTMYLNIFP